MNNNIINKKNLALGIDFGTTNSLVTVILNGKFKIIKYKKNLDLLPSIIHYLSKSKILLGGNINKLKFIKNKNIFFSIKRFIGRNLKEILNFKNIFYNIREIFGTLYFKTSFGFKNVIEISSKIFFALRKIVEKKLNININMAVITVPAYFNELQRKAIKKSANLAGIKVLRLLNEPTAAAIAYKLNNYSFGKFLIYDFGGGTFDVSLLKIKKNIFKVLSIGGDSFLGGDDFDNILFNWILNKLKFFFLSLKDLNKIKLKCCKFKEILSFKDYININFTLDSKKKINFLLTKKKFINLIKPLIKKTIKIIYKILKESNIYIKDICKIILVGGITRIPYLRKTLNKLFNNKILFNINPDKVVSMGAAIQANLLVNNTILNLNKLLLLDVISFSLGIETITGIVEKIINKNTIVPCSYSQYFTTFKNNQKKILLNILQGEENLVVNCKSIAKFELSGISALKAGSPRILITFQIDVDGLLRIFAVEHFLNKKKKLFIKCLYKK